MKRYPILFLSIYAVSIILGFRIGSNLTQNGSAASAFNFSPKAMNTIPAMKNGQHNLLIISTDDLSLTEPKLMSIWLVTYFLDDPTVTFLPVYPTVSNGKIITDTELLDSFELAKLNDQHQISENFQEYLEQRNFWWSGYILIDQSAYTAVIEMTMQEVNDGDRVSDDQVGLTQGDDLQALESVYLRDESNMLYICDQLTQEADSFNWEAFREFAPQHLSTDFDLESMIEEWVGMLASKDKAICSFPLQIGILSNIK